MLRLFLLIALILLSLLTVFKAPIYYLWLAAIIVSEFPFVLITITSIILLLGFWTDRYKIQGTIVGILAILLFVSPVLRAYLIAADLQYGMDNALGGPKEEKKNAFSIRGIFTRKNTVTVPFQTLIYTKYPHFHLSLDFYKSKISGKRPCIIVIHGGSWKSGDNKQLPELNSYLANSGYHVAAINYRLAPKYLNPSAVQDVDAAIKYLGREAYKLGIDTSKFVLLGRSAGAQIALLSAYTLKGSGIKAVIDFYGPADMVWGYSVPSNPLVMNSRKVMEDYLGGTYKEVSQNYENSSPLNFVSKRSVPTLIIHGENDVLVAYEHSRRLHEKLNNYAVKNYFLSLPWATHGFDYTINGPGGQLSTYAVKEFIHKVIH